MVLDTTPTRHHLAKAKSPILRAADRAEPAIRRAMLDALEALQRSVPNLESLIASGNVKNVVDAVKGAGIPQSLMNALTDATATAAIGGAEAAGFEIGFNLPNARAVEWAAAHAGEQITAVSQATKIVVQEIVEDALLRGIHPRVAARQIKNVVPLLPQHQKSVTRLFNSSIDSGVTVSHAEKIAARKSKKLLKYRAEMIARTEAIRASNMCQQLVWQQAIDLDLLPAGVKKIWLATGDDRTCPVCAVMDGQTVEVSGGEFNVNRQATGFVRSGSTFRVSGTKPYRGWGKQASPPAHPQCRCTMILETIDTPRHTQPQTTNPIGDLGPDQNGTAILRTYDPDTGKLLNTERVQRQVTGLDEVPELLRDETMRIIDSALDEIPESWRPATVQFIHDGRFSHSGYYNSTGVLSGKSDVMKINVDTYFRKGVYRNERGFLSPSDVLNEWNPDFGQDQLRQTVIHEAGHKVTAVTKIVDQEGWKPVQTLANKTIDDLMRQIDLDDPDLWAAVGQQQMKYPIMQHPQMKPMTGMVGHAGEELISEVISYGTIGVLEDQFVPLWKLIQEVAGATL